MACGSCGQKRQTVTPAQAQAIASQGSKKAKYTVTAPDGSTQTFNNYLDAAVARRAKNGTLTTTTK